MSPIGPGRAGDAGEGADDGGRVALITGAARGIGAATARRLAAAGWRLVLVDRCHDDPHLTYELSTAADLQSTVDACGGPRRAIGIHADVRDQTALDAAATTARDRFAGLDAAVAVAGCIAGGRQAWRIDDDQWATMIGVNLEGVWRLARATIPVLLERSEPRYGRFVAVASSGGMLGLPLLSAYCAAKHGVVGLVRALAAELGPLGITANVVSPGSTATAMLDASAAVYGLGGTAEFATHHLLPRLLDADEPAALLAWLCGPDSGGITGAVLPVDAGMTAH
ncbi:MAG: mycofactocin-coupled SDR family oxidoreductase [Actinomycetota bacterium]|nr:mycofactocin-coupled SDR family oxidoreductase [Actinomycetota bacterium]